MFTGIVEATGTVTGIVREGSNIHFSLRCPFSQELKIDQSLAHDGCCLTVTAITAEGYTVTAVQETLEKTALATWEVGTEVNLERCMRMDARVDGHIVQGHVDCTGEVLAIEDLGGSHKITVQHIQGQGRITVDQGSITMNGVSLTVAQSGEGQFSVAIIPYTWEFTNFKNLKAGSLVNIEFDIIGKYIAKLIKGNAH